MDGEIAELPNTTTRWDAVTQCGKAMARDVQGLFHDPHRCA